MSILQFFVVMAGIFSTAIITTAALDAMGDKPVRSKEWKDLHMMVQDCNQRYEELNARVNNLERKDDSNR